MNLIPFSGASWHLIGKNQPKFSELLNFIVRYFGKITAMNGMYGRYGRLTQ